MVQCIACRIEVRSHTTKQWFRLDIADTRGFDDVMAPLLADNGMVSLQILRDSAKGRALGPTDDARSWTTGLDVELVGERLDIANATHAGVPCFWVRHYDRSGGSRLAFNANMKRSRKKIEIVCACCGEANGERFLLMDHIPPDVIRSLALRYLSTGEVPRGPVATSTVVESDFDLAWKQDGARR